MSNNSHCRHVSQSTPENLQSVSCKLCLFLLIDVCLGMSIWIMDETNVEYQEREMDVSPLNKGGK
jgi:hypothetical protein